MKTKFNLKTIFSLILFVASIGITTASMAQTETGGKIHHCVTLVLADGSALSYCVDNGTYCATVSDCIN